MTARLTDEQRRILQASPDRHADVVDPLDAERYVLIPASEYEAVRDEMEQAALRRAAVRNLSRRLVEDQ